MRAHCEYHQRRPLMEGNLYGNLSLLNDDFIGTEYVFLSLP